MRMRRSMVQPSIRRLVPALLRSLAPSPTSLGSARLLLNHRIESEVCRQQQKRDEQLPLPATYTASQRPPFGANILPASTLKPPIPILPFSNTCNPLSPSPRLNALAAGYLSKPSHLASRAFSSSSSAMAAIKIDGTALAKKIREGLHAEIAEKQQSNPRYQPCLKIIQGACVTPFGPGPPALRDPLIRENGLSVIFCFANLALR